MLSVKRSNGPMGNCCDRLTDGSIFNDGDAERRPLLGVDGNGRGTESDVVSNSTGVGIKTEYGGSWVGVGSGEKKNDEQSALNRILQTTADQVSCDLCRSVRCVGRLVRYHAKRKF